MSLAGNLVRSMGFHSWITRQFERRRHGKECTTRPASDVCERCGFCCHCAPGALAREDFDKIAEFLKISVTELVEKYITLHDNGPKGNLYPAIVRRGQEGNESGGYLSTRGSWDTEPCVFYEDRNGKGFCKIHPVKPAQCGDKFAGTQGELVWPEAISTEELKKLGFTSFGDSDWDDD